MTEQEDGGDDGGGDSVLPQPAEAVMAEATAAEKEELAREGNASEEEGEEEGEEMARGEGAGAGGGSKDVMMPSDNDAVDIDSGTDTDGSGVLSGSDHGGDDEEFGAGNYPVKDPAFPFGRPAENLTAAAMHGRA